jgi:hypothetical protein
VKVTGLMYLCIVSLQNITGIGFLPCFSCISVAVGCWPRITVFYCCEILRLLNIFLIKNCEFLSVHETVCISVSLGYCVVWRG